MARNKGREGSTVNPSNSRSERTFELDWGSISTTREGFLDTTCILSMLCSYLGGDILDNKDVEQSQNTEAVEDDFDSGDEAVRM